MLIVALQFHEKDREQAATLARFIADVEPARRDDVKILFVTRSGSARMDPMTCEHVNKTFDIGMWMTPDTGDGWPSGPNKMATDLLMHAPDWVAQYGWQGAFGILLLEPDCVPMDRFWTDKIMRAWALALIDGAWCMGSFRQSGPPCGHVNGSMVVRPDFAKLVDLSGCPHDLAWDCYVAPAVMPHACISGLFLNKFRETNATEEILRTPETGGVPPVLVHGFKDRSAEDIARKWMNL